MTYRSDLHLRSRRLAAARTSSFLSSGGLKSFYRWRSDAQAKGEGWTVLRIVVVAIGALAAFWGAVEIILGVSIMFLVDTSPLQAAGIAVLSAATAWFVLGPWYSPVGYLKYVLKEEGLSRAWLWMLTFQVSIATLGVVMAAAIWVLAQFEDEVQALLFQPKGPGPSQEQAVVAAEVNHGVSHPDPVFVEAPNHVISGAAIIKGGIRKIEAGSGGYDAVQWQAHTKPDLPVTAMTLDEIQHWARTTGGQHAVGAYQFIPKTLINLQKRTGLSGRSVLDPPLQDWFADYLLVEQGLEAFLDGRMSAMDYQERLARVWAAIPNRHGRSHYAGIANNKAGISVREFQALLNQAKARSDYLRRR